MLELRFRYIAFVHVVALAGVTGAGIGCDLSDDNTAEPSSASRSPIEPSGKPAAEVGQGAARDDASSLTVMAWNIEWFHDAEHEPRDDAAQYAAVKKILRSSGADVIALAEVSDPRSFARLMRELPDYEGVIADYAWTQKLALVYRDADIEVKGTRRVEGFANAGRPPLHVQLRRTKDDFDFHVLVVHAKAGSEEADWGQRRQLAHGLKAYIESELADAPVIIAGDLNDRLAGSTVARRPSPYESFVLAPGIITPTRALHGGDEASHLSGETLDHILLSDELAPFLDDGSVDVRRDELKAAHPDFGQMVSDHFPVMLRLRR